MPGDVVLCLSVAGDDRVPAAAPAGVTLLLREWPVSLDGNADEEGSPVSRVEAAAASPFLPAAVAVGLSPCFFAEPAETAAPGGVPRLVLAPPDDSGEEGNDSPVAIAVVAVGCGGTWEEGLLLVVVVVTRPAAPPPAPVTFGVAGTGEVVCLLWEWGRWLL